MNKLILLIFIFLLPSIANAQEVIAEMNKTGLAAINEELRQSSSSIRNTKSLISTLQADVDAIKADFNVSTGHDHDGSNSKKVLATYLDTTGLITDGVLYNDSGIISSKLVEINIADYKTGSLIEATAATERGVSSTTYEKKKALTNIPRGGTVNVSFSLIAASSSYKVYGKIYVNDVAVGTEFSNNTNVYVTYSEDITINAGDEISVYAKVSGGAGSNSIKDLILKCANPTIPIEKSGY